METQRAPVVESESVKTYRLRFLLNRRGHVLSFHKPGCEGIEADREWSEWGERWPNHCGSCRGSGIGSYYGGGEYEPPEAEPCEDCILPHSSEPSHCPRCALPFPEDDQALNKCDHCGWDAVTPDDDYPPEGDRHGCSCLWADEDRSQEVADVLYDIDSRDTPFDSEGVVFDAPYVIGLDPFPEHERLYQGGREGDEDSGYWPTSHREALVYALMGSDTEGGMRGDGVPQIRVAPITEQLHRLNEDPETSWVGISHNLPIPHEIQSREELAQDIAVFLGELKDAHWTDPDDDEEGWNESQSEIAPFLDTGARDASNKQRIAHIEDMLDRVRGEGFGRSQRHYMNDAEHISDDELRKQGKILERDSGSQYSPCACGCRILVRRPCLQCGSDQHSHKDRFSCAAMSDGSRRYPRQPQCFRCKAYGHTQKICPLPAPEYPPHTCAYCGEAGHNARWCPSIPDDFEWPIPEYMESLASEGGTPLEDLPEWVEQFLPGPNMNPHYQPLCEQGCYPPEDDNQQCETKDCPDPARTGPMIYSGGYVGKMTLCKICWQGVIEDLEDRYDPETGDFDSRDWWDRDAESDLPPEMIHHPEHDAFIEELNKVFSNYVPTSDGFINYHTFKSQDGSVEIVIVENNDWWMQIDLEENEPPDTYMILEWLYSKDKNQGSAGKVMSEIVNAADRTGVTLHLDCGEHWFGMQEFKEKNAIPAKELAGWYETFGFTEGGPIKRMIRKPERADWNPIEVRWAEFEAVETSEELEWIESHLDPDNDYQPRLAYHRGKGGRTNKVGWNTIVNKMFEEKFGRASRWSTNAQYAFMVAAEIDEEYLQRDNNPWGVINWNELRHRLSKVSGFSSVSKTNSRNKEMFAMLCQILEIRHPELTMGRIRSHNWKNYMEAQNIPYSQALKFRLQRNVDSTLNRGKYHIAPEWQGKVSESTFMNDMLLLYVAQEGCCAVTGRPFPTTSHSPHSPWRSDYIDPWTAPSMDRIDNRYGYQPDNVRLVMLQVQFALNKFPDDSLLDLELRGITEKNLHTFVLPDGDMMNLIVPNANQGRLYLDPDGPYGFTLEGVGSVHEAESVDFEAPSPLCPHGRQRYSCKDCGGRGICEHGRVRTHCVDCDGSQICEHGRRREHCKECGGSGICEHGRQRQQCKECGGSSICEHGRRRHRCKECGGSEICEHGRSGHYCKECGGSQICEHEKDRSRCKECGGGSICEHGRQRGRCKDCDGSELCEHNRHRRACRVCSRTGITKCGHCGKIGHNRRTCPDLHESFHAAESADFDPTIAKNWPLIQMADYADLYEAEGEMIYWEDSVTGDLRWKCEQCENWIYLPQGSGYIGRKRFCDDCLKKKHNQQASNYYYRNLEKAAAYKKAYREKNREKINAYKRANRQKKRAEGNDEEPPHTRAIAGVSDSVAKFANANDTDDWAYAFGGLVAGFVLMPLVGTLISGWLMSKLKKRNWIPWDNDDAEQG